MARFSPGNLLDGRRVVPSSGTPVQLSTETAETTTVVIYAETDNSGYIVVGDTTVVAATATRRGIPLAAGDSITMNINQLHYVWLDTTASGDGVTFLAEAV